MHKKVAFIGSVGSGKTTVIENLSGIGTLNTDVESSVEIGKDLTTVGIDYGHVVIDDTTTLGLYGVPGQRRFSMVWDFVKDGLWAVIILVKNNNLESIEELNYLIEYFEINEDLPCIICVTHVDQSSGDDTVGSIKKVLDECNLDVPVYTIDSRLSSSAELIMRTLIAIEENL